VVAFVSTVASTFGELFQIATWGESHGPGIGVVVDGCPPRLAITREEIQVELDRRRPGQSRITSHRDESDQVEILSGVETGDQVIVNPSDSLVNGTTVRLAEAPKTVTSK